MYFRIEIFPSARQCNAPIPVTLWLRPWKRTAQKDHFCIVINLHVSNNVLTLFVAETGKSYPLQLYQEIYAWNMNGSLVIDH